MKPFKPLSRLISATIRRFVPPIFSDEVNRSALWAGLVLSASLAATQNLTAAVNFSVTPGTVSDAYVGPVVLQIGGLTNGETVVVQKHLDLNANGVADGSDWLVQQFRLTDGQAGMVIGGVTNFNVPGDTDAAANGQITAKLNFPSGDFRQNLVGSYLFTVSSPGGHFAPLTSMFSITNFPFPQKLAGTVLSNNTSTVVPNAVVVLFPPGATNPPQAGAVADSAGKFSIAAAPGVYAVCAFKTNCLAYLTSNAPIVSLGGGQMLTTNIMVTNATAQISGRLVDSTQPNLGLPGVLVAAKSPQGVIAIASTDANGNFEVPANSGPWDVKQDGAALIVHGYVGPDNWTHTAGGASGITFAVSKATALIYGNVQDNFGNPLRGLDVYLEDDNDLYSFDGSLTDANGNYVLAVIGLGSSDNWRVEPNGDNQLTNYLFSAQTNGWNVNAGQAAPQNFTGLLATNHITGWLKDNNGNPLSGIYIYDFAMIGSLEFGGNGAITDANGDYSLDVGNGTWDVGVAQWGGQNSLPPDYLPPPDQYPVILNSDAVADFIAALTYTVTNNSDVFTFIVKNGAVTILRYSGAGGAVAIPSTLNNYPVTGIGSNAFEYSWTLSSLTLPDTVTNIAENAFAWCGLLNAVGVGTNLASIGAGAFQNCSSLAFIVFQGNAPALGSNVFAGDYYATAYYSAGTIGWGPTFGGIRTAQGFWSPPFMGTISNGVATIMRYLGSASAVSIPATINNLPVAGIGASAFSGDTSLTSIVIPAGVTNIGPEAFQNCANLTVVSFLGNAPATAGDAFADDANAIALYGVGTIGWGTTLGGLPTAQGFWSPPYAGTITNGLVTILKYAGPGGQVTVPPSLNSLPVAGIGSSAFLENSRLTSIALPAGITTIGPNAFDFCTSLTNATLSSSLRLIGDYAFDSCSALATVTLPPGLLSIGAAAFDGCAFTTLSIPGSVTNVGDYAFQGCVVLTNATVDAALIGADAFAGCLSLTNVVFGAGVLSIGDVAFSACPLTNVDVPDSVTNVGVSAFEYCSSLGTVTIGSNITSIADETFAGCAALANVILRGHVTAIGASAFASCTSLISLVLPDTVQTIGDYAFYEAGLAFFRMPTNTLSIGTYAFDGTVITNITIPALLTNIGTYAFLDCFNLLAINVSPQNAFYSSINGVLFDKSQRALLVCPNGLSGSYSIPPGVTNIGDAFQDCAFLASVTVGNNVAELGYAAFSGCSSLTNLTIGSGVASIDSDAFDDCFSLLAINVSSQNLYYSSVNGILFDSSQHVLVKWPGGRTGGYVIPGTVTDIGTAFQGCGLSSVTVPGSVSILYDYAFAYSHSLTNVLLENGISDIGGSAFFGCPLTAINLPASVSTVEVYAFLGCQLLTAANVDSRNPFYSSLQGVLFDKAQATLVEAPEGLTGSYTVPGTVTNIAQGAFQLCQGLTNIIIPASVAVLGDYVFWDCFSLLSATFLGNAPAVGPITSDWLFTDDNSATVYYLWSTTGWGSTFGGRPTQPIFSPTVQFSANPTAGAAPLAVQFNAPNGDSQGNIITNWNWNFGDGATSASQSPSHIYSTEGVFWPTLVATNVAGVAVQGFGAGIFVTNAGAYPVAIGFSADGAFLLAIYGQIGGAYTLQASTDLASWVSITNFICIDSPMYVADPAAKQYSRRFYRLVLGTVATALSFSANPTTGPAPLAVSFSSPALDSTGAAIVNWSWDFGDGATSSLQNPTHTFTNAGTFNPTLTATNIFNVAVLGYGPQITVATSPTWCLTYITNNGAITITGYTCPGGPATIPPSMNGLPVTSIDSDAFQSDGLTSAAIPETVTNIGIAAFNDNPDLTVLTVSPSNPAYSSVGGVLFDKHQTTIVKFPDGSSDTAYIIPNTVTNVGDWSFANCHLLTSVTIPAGVLRIGDFAFVTSGLATVAVPNTVTSIGQEAFACFGLANITVDPHSPSYSSLDGVLFDKNQSLLVQYPGDKPAGTYAVPNGVAGIGDEAFAFASSLTNVLVPSSVSTLGVAAFEGCSVLTGVFFGGDAPAADCTVFNDGAQATVYYLPGTANWGSTFACVPTAPWARSYPLILNGPPGFGVKSNAFAFTVSWASNASVVVEASTNLLHPVWLPIQTNALGTNGWFYFTDPRWTNYPSRFYRALKK